MKMTSDEAISILTSLQEPEAWEPQVTEKVFTALQMAIEALAKDINVPSNDCISREAAIDSMTNTLWHYPNELYRNLKEYEFAKGLAELGLKSVPSAQPERKKGEWTKDNACEFCGFKPWYEGDIHTLSYCPNCGADMRGE
jgi:hypothetical protein